MLDLSWFVGQDGLNSLVAMCSLCGRVSWGRAFVFLTWGSWYDLVWLLIDDVILCYFWRNVWRWWNEGLDEPPRGSIFWFLKFRMVTATASNKKNEHRFPTDDLPWDFPGGFGHNAISPSKIGENSGENSGKHGLDKAVSHWFRPRNRLSLWTLAPGFLAVWLVNACMKKLIICWPTHTHIQIYRYIDYTCISACVYCRATPNRRGREKMDKSQILLN